MKTILLVDDSAMIRELGRDILSSGGYKVVEASDGAEAIEKFNSNAIDLSIIDIFMPHKGGLQVMSEILKKDKTHKIIAISGGEAFNANSILELTRIFKITETLSKPLDAAKLLAAVKRLLGE